MEYHPGQLNTMAGVLSRCDFDIIETAAGAHALSGPLFRLIDNIRAATTTADDARHLLQQLHDGELGEL